MLRHRPAISPNERIKCAARGDHATVNMLLTRSPMCCRSVLKHSPAIEGRAGPAAMLEKRARPVTRAFRCAHPNGLCHSLLPSAVFVFTPAKAWPAIRAVPWFLYNDYADQEFICRRSRSAGRVRGAPRRCIAGCATPSNRWLQSRNISPLRSTALSRPLGRPRTRR